MRARAFTEEDRPHAECGAFACVRVVAKGAAKAKIPHNARTSAKRL